MKVRSLVVLCNHSAFYRWSAQNAALLLLSSVELMSCCAVDANGYVNLRCRAFPLGGQVSAKLSRCPGSMARRARDSVGPLRRSSAGWMPARLGRLSVGVGRSHPVTFARWRWWLGQWGGCDHCDTWQERRFCCWVENRTIHIAMFFEAVNLKALTMNKHSKYSRIAP